MLFRDYPDRGRYQYYVHEVSSHENELLSIVRRRGLRALKADLKTNTRHLVLHVQGANNVKNAQSQWQDKDGHSALPM